MENDARLYLTACLLSYYQQLRLFEDRKAQYKAFALEKPLWVFVGSKVTAIRTENKKQVSDVVDILLFMAELVTVRVMGHLQPRHEDTSSGDIGLQCTQQLRYLGVFVHPDGLNSVPLKVFALQLGLALVVGEFIGRS